MEEMLIGVTDRTIPVFIADPASTDGGGLTELVDQPDTVPAPVAALEARALQASVGRAKAERG